MIRNFFLNSCWINSNSALIGAFLVPLFLAIAINTTLFAIILRRIHLASAERRGAKGLQSTSKSREVRAAISMFTLMGLSWIFGAFINTGDPDSSLVFQ